MSEQQPITEEFLKSKGFHYDSEYKTYYMPLYALYQIWVLKLSDGGLLVGTGYSGRPTFEHRFQHVESIGDLEWVFWIFTGSKEIKPGDSFKTFTWVNGELQ